MGLRVVWKFPRKTGGEGGAAGVAMQTLERIVERDLFVGDNYLSEFAGFG